MEEKQLNFNRPLLSVRHFTSGAPIENESKRKNDKSFTNMPRPPRYKSELKSGPVTNPGTIPFLWEKIPGKPKDETRSQTKIVDRLPLAPKLPPGRALIAHHQGPDKNQGERISCVSQNVPVLDEDIERSGRPEDAKEGEESSSSRDDEEAYVDARDTLSRTESFFVNCSVSGLSGFDDLDVNSGNSSTDQQTRDFMMGRFLPAAKAMVSETHSQHAPWKPPKVQQPPRQFKEVVSSNKQPLLRYSPDFEPDYSKGHDSRDEESDNDSDEQEIFPDRFCGSLPRLGLKGSFCLLNPLPGMSVRTRTTPLSRKQASSSSFGSWSELDNEQYRLDMSKHKSVGGCQMIKPQVSKDAKNDDDPNDGWSHHESLEVGGVSSNHNRSPPSYEQKAQLSCSEEAKNLEANGCESNKNASQSFQNSLGDRNKSKELDTGIPVAEKTLYVDTVHKVKSCSSSRKRQSDINEKESRILTDPLEQNRIGDSSPKDIEQLSIADKAATPQPDIQKLDFHVLSMSDKVNLKPFRGGQDLYKGSFISASLKMPREESSKTHQTKPAEEEKKMEKYSQFLIPPPLPKSPTDSWLGRTLPTMSAKNASSVHRHLGTGTAPKYQVSKPKSSDPKWETIVKATNKPHQHLHFTEEQLRPISET